MTDSHMHTRILAKVLAQIEHLREQQITLYRDLHEHPEPPGQEKRTAKVIAEELHGMGLTVQTDISGHGVVGTLCGQQPGPVVAYYAPMDAPLVPPANYQPEDGPKRMEGANARHVSGHDVYMAIALGVARILAAMRDQIPGRVRFIFQPAEMSVDGTYARPSTGAYDMLNAGILDDPTPRALFALSVAPMPTGRIMVGPGVGLPGVERFEITLKRKGDLAVQIEKTLSALNAISTLPPFGGLDPQTIFGWLLEENGPLESFINVRMEPAEHDSSLDDYTIRGRIKASDERAFAQAREQIKQALDGLSTDDMCFDLIYLTPRVPNLRSDPLLAQANLPALEAVVGKENVLIQRATFPHGRAGFAFFAERVPSVMLFVGASNFEKGIISLPNTQNFDIDNEALIIGTKAMVSVVMNSLFETT